MLTADGHRCVLEEGLAVAHAEVAALDAQRLAHAEERIEHQLLRHDAQLPARLRMNAMANPGVEKADFEQSTEVSK